MKTLFQRRSELLCIYTESVLCCLRCAVLMQCEIPVLDYFKKSTEMTDQFLHHLRDVSQSALVTGAERRAECVHHISIHNFSWELLTLHPKSSPKLLWRPKNQIKNQLLKHGGDSYITDTADSFVAAWCWLAAVEPGFSLEKEMYLREETKLEFRLPSLVFLIGLCPQPSPAERTGDKVARAVPHLGTCFSQVRRAAANACGGKRDHCAIG